MRDFLRETDGFFAQYMPGITRRFFYINVLVTLVYWIATAIFAQNEMMAGLIRRVFILVPEQAILQGNIWQFLISIFNHDNFFHLFGNMLVLFFFGPLVEREMGTRRFGWFLILAGLAGGLVHCILAFAMGRPEVGLLGFSGAGFAILTAATLWFPNIRVMLMLMIPVPLRVLAVIIGIFLALGILENIRMWGFMGGRVSHEAHLAGVLMALALIRFRWILRLLEGIEIPFVTRRGARIIPIGRGKGKRRGTQRFGMGHPGRHTDPDDLYNDPHWYLDQ
ncbi:MAG: rhomboid family intramembrane serine protease [Candidatus Sumerlaeia bacterium]|nr:rhomboid family intramembrane serine protease [Candidatus Sumerlaeia bacterium]